MEAWKTDNDIQLIKIEKARYFGEEMFVNVKKALAVVGVNREITAYQVVGCGIQQGICGVCKRTEG